VGDAFPSLDFGCSFDITLALRGGVRLVVFLVACQVFEEPRLDRDGTVVICSYQLVRFGS
jgi:hypothetical protein